MNQQAPLRLDPPGDGAPLWRSFDHDWYACAYFAGPDPARDPAWLQCHYHETGAAIAHAPNRWFDEVGYRLRNPDVAGAIAEGKLRSGFEHYCRDGWRNREPHWLFDSGVYFAPGGLDTTDVAAEDCINLYGHFLRHGARLGRQPHLLFDATFYRRNMAAAPGAAAAIEAIGAWHHFVDRIWFDGCDAVTTAWFDPDWYLARYPDAARRVQRRTTLCALHDYLTVGITAGASPLSQFDEGFYLGANADVAEAVRAGRHASGYDHFLRLGAHERRQPTADIDLRRYHDKTPAARIAIATGTARDVFTHLVLSANAISPPCPTLIATPPEPRLVHGGHIDSHGFAALAGGWIFLGWLPGGVLPGPAPGTTTVQATARFGGAEHSGPATLVRFARADLPGAGAGAVVFLPSSLPDSAPPQGSLVELDLEAGGDLVRLPARVAAEVRDEPTLVTHATASIATLPPSDPALTRLRVLLARRPYTGSSTLDALHDPVFFQIDESILCPPSAPGRGARAGLAFYGWMLTPPGTVVEVRLHCGKRSAALVLNHVPRLPRPDVLEKLGATYGLAELHSGFLAYAPDMLAEGEAPHIAISTGRGEIGYKPIPSPRLRGMEAIQYLLACAEPRYAEVVPAFEHVFGPAVSSLNAARMRTEPEYRIIDFGQPPEVPRITVIVTLHRRLDFLEYQIAFFRHARAMPFELIYVLDDPPRARQLEILAASAFARFDLPFRIVVLAHNLGFAPANNVGLALARAPYVCFLNSDVFPGTPDWMERLVARLRDTPKLGAVGPLLLYEDGTIQHQGMRFERMAQFGDFHFPMHPGKGWRPPAIDDSSELYRADAITGACIVMARWLAQEMGGFDTAFPIGDFEDSDLCLRLRGLEVAVDMGVRLYHLERQSQAGSEKPWRMNLTLYNAWLHDHRWRDTIDALSASSDDDPEVIP